MDVIDSEYESLLRDIRQASDLQYVMKAHRNFMAVILRLTMADNVVVQEGIDRVIQVVLRFIALLWTYDEEMNVRTQKEELVTSTGRARYQQSPRNQNEALFLSELESIKKEFSSQINYLFQIMRTVENRGLMFRLDFNGYFSGTNADVFNPTF